MHGLTIFFKNNILQGDVATACGCGGKFCSKLSSEFISERILKIDQSLTKL